MDATSHGTHCQVKGPTYMHFYTPLYTAKRKLNELCLMGKKKDTWIYFITMYSTKKSYSYDKDRSFTFPSN